MYHSYTENCMSSLQPECLLRTPDRLASKLLTLDRVSKQYWNERTSVVGLDRVSLTVQQGEFVALVGRSGCGKSTLLNLAGAMDLPTSGDVLLEGIATSSLSDSELTQLRREKVGFVFQSFQLLQTLSVIENIELPLLLAGRSDARNSALKSLAEVDLDGYAFRLPHQLSGGQMQRVAIARAIVHSPRLLLADEPTGNLDTHTGELILKLLHRISAEQKTTILMATHSLNLPATRTLPCACATDKS